MHLNTELVELAGGFGDSMVLASSTLSRHTAAFNQVALSWIAGKMSSSLLFEVCISLRFYTFFQGRTPP